MHGSEKPASDAALAYRAAFELGRVAFYPATRSVHGPTGEVAVQPRVMHVLLALVDAQGAVVTREELADRCWKGRFVAEDSLNGAIAELRKALRAVGASDVNIETVPKTGYRLVTSAFAERSNEPPRPTPHATVGKPKVVLSRRLVLVGGTAAGVAAAGGFWWTAPERVDGEASLLIARGEQALHEGLPESGVLSVGFFSRAVRLDPQNAKAWGMLALGWRAAAEYGDPQSTGQARSEAEIAAKRALALDERQSDALTALATLTPALGDWINAERRVQEVLEDDPANVFAVAALGTILMSTGQIGACLERLDWLVRKNPLSPNVQFRRVYTLWSAGRLAEMDRTADNALQAWPHHPAVWFARFWTLAFTSRVAAAQAMLMDAAARPAMPRPAFDILAISMRALTTNSADDMSAAVAANVVAASRGPGQATTAIMVLSQLRAADEALNVAQGFLVQKGSIVVQSRHTSAQPSVTDQHHRLTMMLWIPATEPLRLHPDFRILCDGIGMLDYWRATGKRPEFRKGSLAVI